MSSKRSHYILGKNQYEKGMKLDEYLFRTKTTREEFAEKVGVSRGHLQHILGRSKRPSVKLAKKIEEATGGKVSKEEVLFPEDYPDPDFE